MANVPLFGTEVPQNGTLDAVGAPAGPHSRLASTIGTMASCLQKEQQYDGGIIWAVRMQHFLLCSLPHHIEDACRRNPPSTVK